MQPLKYLKADTSHPFVALVQQYCDERRHETEFRRRKEIHASRQRGDAVHDSINAGTGGKGGRPNLTAEDTRELIDNIIEGRIVPSAVQTHSLAIQFGLTGEDITQFVNEGGRYVMHCATTSQQDHKKIRLDFPPGESMQDALAAIAGRRKLSNRGDKALLPEDAGYRASRLKLSFARMEHYHAITGGNRELARKLNVLSRDAYRFSPTPEKDLLTEEEMQTLCASIRCSPEEEIRLRIAHGNTEAHIHFINEPQVRDAAVMETLNAYNSGSLKKTVDSPGGGPRLIRPFEALHSMLHIKGLRLRDKETKAEWDILTNLARPPAVRAASFNRLAEKAGISHIEGIADFRDHLLAQTEIPKLVGPTRRSTLVRRAEAHLLEKRFETPDEGPAR